MKIQIDFDEKREEEVVIIKCSKLDSRIRNIQQAILNVTSEKQSFPFYKGDKEYYISLEEILFFETTEKRSLCTYNTRRLSDKTSFI